LASAADILSWLEDEDFVMTAHALEREAKDLEDE